MIRPVVILGALALALAFPPSAGGVSLSEIESVTERTVLFDNFRFGPGPRNAGGVLRVEEIDVTAQSASPEGVGLRFQGPFNGAPTGDLHAVIAYDATNLDPDLRFVAAFMSWNPDGDGSLRIAGLPGAVLTGDEVRTGSFFDPVRRIRLEHELFLPRGVDASFFATNLGQRVVEGHEPGVVLVAALGLVCLSAVRRRRGR
jgi:hypothetical protein